MKNKSFAILLVGVIILSIATITIAIIDENTLIDARRNAGMLQLTPELYYNEETLVVYREYSVRNLKTGLVIFYSPLIGETGNYYRYVNGVIEELEHLPYE